MYPGFQSLAEAYLLYHAARDVDLNTAIKALNFPALDIEKLVHNVRGLASWWDVMGEGLRVIQRDSSSVRPGKDKLRVKAIKKRWIDIRDDYEQYKAQVR